MKNTLFLTGAAIAAVLLGSCSKDMEPDNSIKGDEVEYIYATFENGGNAKTAIDGLKTTWVVNDEIWLSDASASVKGTVVSTSDEGKTARIEYSAGTLTGDDIYAVYPYAAGVGVSDGKISFKIAQTQSGNFADANISAACGKKAGGLGFKNATSIFKITNDGTSVKVKFPQNFGGTYSIDLSGDQPVIAAVSADSKCIESDLSKSTEKDFWYISVAPGIEFAANATIASYEDCNDASLKGDKTTSGGITLVRNKIYNLKAPVIDRGVLEGVFSVSASKKVQFSRGNLVGHLEGGANSGSTGKWDFEQKQYYFRMYPGANDDKALQGTSLGTTPAQTVGTFYYSEDINKACRYTSEENKDQANASGELLFTNVAANDVTVYGSKEWMALTQQEYEYLCKTRTTSSGHHYFKGKVNYGSGVINGLFLIPDDLLPDKTWPAGVTEPAYDDNCQTTPWGSATEYSLADFAKLEKAGIVFLPCIGLRDGSRYYPLPKEGDEVWSLHEGKGNCINYNTQCSYWSTTWDRMDTFNAIKEVKDVTIVNIIESYLAGNHKAYNGYNYAKGLLTTDNIVEYISTHNYPYCFTYAFPIRLAKPYKPAN